MDSLLIWKTALWSAPILGAVIGGIISLFANFKINSLEAELKKQDKIYQQEFQNKTLTNQDKLLNNGNLVLEKTKVISTQINENKNFIIKQVEKTNKQFEITNRPELNIIQDLILVKGNNHDYNITVKNFGKSTAKNVIMAIKYIMPNGFEFNKRIEELPLGEKIVFQVPIVPDFVLNQSNSNWENERKDFINEFNNGNKNICFRVRIDYEWEKNKYSTREFIFIHEHPDKITMW
jgi:hypothetical protein